MIFEIPSSFQMGAVCFFLCINGAAIFILCALPMFCVLQCSVLCWLTLVLLSMGSYEADNGLKNQSYMDAWLVSLRLVEFHSKDQSPPANMALLLTAR